MFAAWSQIERIVQQIESAVEADRAKPQSNAAFDHEVERLRAFARTRSAYVECEVANARAATGEIRSCEATLQPPGPPH